MPTAERTTEDLGDESDLYRVLWFLYSIIGSYLWLLPICLGVPGNIISIFVANRRQNRRLSPCIYMSAMAITDTLLLLQLGWYYPFTSWELGARVSLQREFIFKFVWFMVFNCGMLSGLFLAEMSIDRLIAVRFPMTAPSICTTSRAKKTVVISAMIITVLNSHIFFVYSYVKDQNTGVEVLLVTAANPVIEILASGFQMVIGSFLPFLVIFGSNVVIIITVKTAARKRLKMEASQCQEKRNETQYLTRMLIFVSIAYVVTSMPFRMYYLIIDVPEIHDMYNMDVPYWNICYNVEESFFFLIWLFNFAINFYLYCVGGGQKYRNDTVKVITSIRTLWKRKGHYQ
ncbi:growth hormone secretagogue receptor type 1-like [Lineus longissimus]|uniref:growth hormone secretagogue receptor type 1-like n=1 Tax=Lineus longissimus TaxID=88925 RepID=UPI002B4F3BEC